MWYKHWEGLMKLNKPFWNGVEELRISGFSSKTSINFNVNGVTKAVRTQYLWTSST